jgi:hypothetical protein
LPLDVTADAGDNLVPESALLKVELGLMYRWSFNRGANVDVDGFIDFDVDVDLLEDASLRCDIEDRMEMSDIRRRGKQECGKDQWIVMDWILDVGFPMVW